MNTLPEDDSIWLDVVHNNIITKMKFQCERISTNIPFVPYGGKYRDCMMPDGISWWTNGFWPGMLWQMYHATGDAMYKNTAEGVEERLNEALCSFEKLHHDVGFMFLPSSGANYRITGNKEALNRAMHAANLLAGRFNPTGEFIRAWNESAWADDVSGWMIVDSLINISLLYWASEISNDPRYSDIANRHARTAMKCLMRPDGSCNHIASFDPSTGEFLGGIGGQGYGGGSSWSRGQSWTVYGYALAYHHTGIMEYLDTAKQCAHYCISNLAVNHWLPLLDFRAPKEPVKYDSGAAVIIACGLLEISTHVSELEKEFYTNAAIRILRSCEEKFVNWNVDEDGILGGQSTMYHDERLANMSFIYGDYFFVEAILRLKDEALFIW